MYGGCLIIHNMLVSAVVTDVMSLTTTIVQDYLDSKTRYGNDVIMSLRFG